MDARTDEQTCPMRFKTFYWGAVKIFAFSIAYACVIQYIEWTYCIWLSRAKLAVLFYPFFPLLNVDQWRAVFILFLFFAACMTSKMSPRWRDCRAT